MVTFAQKGSANQGIGLSMIFISNKNELITPSSSNILLNNIEYATNEVTQGKNIANLNNCLYFNEFCNNL